MIADLLGIEKAWRSLCISIDTIFVKFIDWVYSIIIDISSARLITSSQVKGLTDRLFLLISVIMLFVVVYSLLRGIINPENATKGNYSGGKIVSNFIKSLALIILIPSVFDALYAVQKAALEENIVGRLITGAESSEVSNYKELSHGMGATLYFTFFQNNGYPGYDDMVTDVRDNDNWDRLKDDDTLDAVVDGQIKYTIFLPVISSLFVIYVLIIYCFDLGVRSIKLAFLQIISPIPAMMLMVPGQEKIFSSWLKTSISTFLEVFIKIAVLIFGFQIITFVNDPESGILALFGDNPIANVFLILGIIAFINKAPKLISDIFGISSASNFSIKDRWKDIKEGYNTLTLGTKPVSSTVGRIGGAVSAYNYHKKVLKETNRQSSGFETLASLYTGASRGAKYGMKFGKVTNDQLLSEKLWANEDYQQKNLSQKVELAVMNSLRDNFGFKYKIDEDLDIGDLALIERNSEDERNIEIMKNSLQTRIKEVKTKFNPVLKRNERAQTILKSKLDLVNSILKEENSNIKSEEFKIPLIKRSINENGDTITEISESKVQLNYHQMEKLENDLKNPNSEMYSLYSDEQRRVILKNIDEQKEKVANKAMKDSRISERVKQFDIQLKNLSNLDSNLGNDLDGNNSYQNVLGDYLKSTDTYSLLKKLNKAVLSDKSKIQMDTELADISDTFRFTIDGQEVERNVNGLTYDNELEFFNERIKERTDLKAKKDTALKSEVELFHKLHDSNPKNRNKN